MMRIVVTGGAGFLGSHLCEELLKRGKYVICVDNFYTGSMKNIELLRNHPCFEIIRHDITLPLYLECDQIYNLACPASPKYYQANPLKTVKCNTVGMINMLGLARRNKARLLQASTSEIYGDPLVHPQSEDYRGNVDPLSIRACYDEGKRIAETICIEYHRQHGVDVRIVRIFNTYGPGMTMEDGRVVSNFIVQALQGKDLTLYGNGQQSRSFLYVADLIEGMIRVMNKENFLGPVNLGNPQEMTVEHLARHIISLTGSTSKISYAPLPKDDPLRRKPDIALAKKELEWEPSIPLEEGLLKTIAYFRSTLEISK